MSLIYIKGLEKAFSPRFWTAHVLKFLARYRLLLLILTLTGLLVDIFFLNFTSDLVIIFLLVLWLVSVRLFFFGERVSVAVALCFLTLCPFLLILKKDAAAEKAAIWAYLFLVVGVVRASFRLRRMED